MKKTLLVAFAALATSFSFAQNVNIPDANFKAYLVGNTSINTNADTEIQVSEAANFTGMIQCENMGITDMTGIGEFINITTLRCGDNAIGSLNLVNNTQLAGTFRCDNNSLTTLELPNSSALTEIYCGGNQLTTIDISVVPNITLFHAVNNSFTSLDFSSNTALEVINFGYSPLTSVDFTGMTNLDYLACQGSGLLSLDVSPATALTGIYAPNMANVTEVNLANGNYLNWGQGLSMTGCPNLTCVTVDNVAFANQVWSTGVDQGVVFSTDCNQGGTPLATSVTVSGWQGATTVNVGADLQMVAEVLPVNAAQVVMWQVQNGTGQATIDQNTGLLTGVGVGTVTVGAAAIDGSNVYGTMQVDVVDGSSGIEEFENGGVVVYPNPTNEMINVSSEFEIIEIQIFDLTGKVVQKETTASFNVSELNNGVYIINVLTENGLAQKHFVKK